MKKRSLTFLFFLIISVNAAVQSQNLAKDWDEVARLEKQAQPKSALEKVTEIEKKAQKQNNRPQQIRALLYRSKLQRQIKQDASLTSIDEIQQFKLTSADAVEQAFLSSLLAGMYKSYYDQNSWQIRQRTVLTGYIPEDIKEWSNNIFQDTITALLKLSLIPADKLQQTKATVYSDLLELGKDSRTQRPTMFDLLSCYALDLLSTPMEMNLDDNLFSENKNFINLPHFQDEKLEIYRGLLKFHLNGKFPDALIMTDLSRLEYVYNNSASDNRDSLYMLRLDELLKQFSENPVSVEVMEKKARLLLQERFKNCLEEDFDPAIPQKVYDLCRAGIRKFPNYPRIGILKNILEEIQEKTAQLSVQGVIHSSQAVRVTIHYANITDPVITLWRYDMEPDHYEKADAAERKKYRKKVAEKKLNLIPTNFYIAKDTVIEFPAQAYGVFGISMTAPSAKEEVADFSISDFIQLEREIPGSGGKELLVLDSESGKPVPGVSVKFYEYVNKNSNLKFEEKTDEAGRVILPYTSNRQLRFSIEKGNDRYAAQTRTYFYKPGNPAENREAQYAIFTDRAIYRPGQTIRFKAIAYLLNKEQNEVIPDKEIKIMLRDANYQPVGEQTLRTNEFGSVASSFVLPENVKSGYFTIEVGNQRKNIRVEEYKRPTFEVNFDKQTATYSFGDTVSITGNVQSLMGVASPGANVKYRVVRQPDFLFRTGFISEKQVAEGETKSDENGKFTFSFVPQKDRKSGLKEAYYRYQILVEATDAAGETQKNELYIPVGDRSMRLSLEVPDRLLSSSIGKLSVKAQTLNGEPVQAAVRYSIFLLNDIEKLPEDAVDANKLTRKKQVAAGTVESNRKDWNELQQLSESWEPGYYRFVLEANDDKGRTVLDSANTVFYKQNEKTPPVKTHLWTEIEQTELVHGDTATFRIGSSDENVWLYYNVRRKDSEIQTEWIQLNNEIRDFEIPFNEAYGTAMEVEFFFVKNGKIYRNNLSFRKKEEKKELDLQLTTFRDKLQPGGKEEWTLQLSNQKDRAEVLAVMYDASLDKLQKNDWLFRPVYREYINFPYWNMDWRGENSLYLYWNRSRAKEVIFSYDKIPGMYFESSYAGGPRIFRNSMSLGNNISSEVDNIVVMEDADAAAPVQKEMRVRATGAVQELAEVAYNEEAGGVSTPPENVQLRTNFAETAFFYPQLKTNDKGEVLLSFTVPESLTRWRFMGLAHTADLYTGQVEKEVVTQKSLMVMPNLPRFLRQGDNCVLTAKVINLSETSQQGKATFELIDPETEKVILVKSVDFNVDAGKTEVVSWSFSVPENQEIVTCRITGKSKTHSDGEQRMLPVLSDKILITESMPMTVRSSETRTFTFDKLKNSKSNTLQNKLLELEFTANPAWYAVQALPSVTVPESPNAFSLTGAYYASTLATHIARSQPKIAAMIEVWKKQGGTKETLLSNLQKNQELKNVLLEETPWVLEAKDETEQKQRLSLLFDLNTQEENAAEMMTKLRELQLPDGSFPWFARMSGSRYVTAYLLNQLARLSKLGAAEFDSEVKQMQLRALNYLDGEIQRDYENLKKYSKDFKNAKINSEQLYYQVVRSAYRDIPVAKNALEANKFYYGLIKTQWTEFGLYEKAMAALASYNNGDAEIAKKIVNSLREHATMTDEMGMFWDKNRTGYFWNQSAIATLTAILDAFAQIDPKTEELSEMRIWLLKQKQTQRWESTTATVDAIYALLLRGDNWLSADNRVTIQMGGKTIVPQNPEAGTGYFTEIISGSEIRPELGEVRITKEGNGIAWGALYWQYLEELDKVEKAKTALHIEKTMMLEKVTAKGRELQPVTEKTALKVGDKVIVRLVIRTDRDLEFVALKDQRAACLEPVSQLSGYQYREGLGYYQSPKDASMQYFFDRLPQGTYVMEYPLWVTNAGEYTNGITTLQCLYAPEFVSHTESVKLRVLDH
ncbi:MAG: hypothetical protein LBR52_05990 [Prevotellaceae bacterium]|nr:hypothetical protein [Prevotellaceae bacterium]